MARSGREGGAPHALLHAFLVAMVCFGVIVAQWTFRRRLCA